MIGNLAAAMSAYCLLPTAYWPLAWAINPAFFWVGAGLVAIPIIIHILNRRRFRTVPWAAMEYLLQAMRKNRRRLKFEQWLLLATRCCLLGLLGLALARPLGCADGGMAAMAGRYSGLHVFVIDNSYSMAYEADRPEAKTHLEQAKRLAVEMIDRLAAGGESVAIITASRPAAGVIVRPTYDLEAAREAVRRIEQSWGGTDLPGALQLALEIGQDETKPSRRLYLLTDGTRSAWETADAEVIRQLGQALAREYRLAHFHLGRAEQWNHAVLDVWPADNLVTTRLSHAFTARARGYGTGPEAMLQWRIDGQVLPGGQRLALDPDTQPQTHPDIMFRSGGPHVVSVGLVTDDRLGVDNVRHRVVEVTSELKALIVEGERGMGSLSGSGAFLELALAPPTEGGPGPEARTSASYVAPEVISELELANKVLADYRAVILAGVGQVSAHQADQLRAFVTQGGTLILFMGEQVSHDNYSNVLLPRGLMPGPLVQRVNLPTESPALFDFRPHGLLHPLLREFAGVEDSGLETARVFNYWQVEVDPESNVERVLNYRFHRADGAQRGSSSRGETGDGGDPAITVHSLEQGRVVFVSTTANPDWTDLPAKPAYVSLVHELLLGSIDTGDRWLNLTVGERLEIPPTIRLTILPVLTDASRRDVPVEQITTGDGRTVYRSEPLTQPGVYTLETGPRSIPVAVNVPADEADVRTLNDAAIRAALGGVNVDFYADHLPVESGGEQRGADFGWTIMLLVLGLLAAECFMAMRFGHYRRK
jgi:hypothetical protein